MATSTKSLLLFGDDPPGSTNMVDDDTVNSGAAGGTASGNPIDLGASANAFITDTAADAADGIYFVSTQAKSDNSAEIYEEQFGKTPTFTSANAVLASPIPNVIQAGQSSFIFSMAVDATDHILYYESNFNFYEVKYGSSFSNTPAAPTLLATLPHSINAMAFDQADHTAYFTANNVTESIGFAPSTTTETINGNYVYKLSGVTPTATSASVSLTTLNVPYTGSTNPGLTAGIAVDSANDTVYFTTAAPLDSTADPGAKAGVYSLPANFTATTPITTVDQTGIAAYDGVESTIVVDAATGDYYFTGVNGNGQSAIYSGNISGSSVAQIYASADTLSGVSLVDGPVFTGAAVTSIDGNTGRTTGEVQPGDVVAIIVTFNSAVNVTGTPTITLNNGITVNYASGSGTDNLVFSYAVGATTAQSVAQLALTAVNANGGTILQPGTGLMANYATATASFAGLRVDTTAPTLSVTGTSSDVVQGGGSLILLTTAPTITDTTGNGIMTGAEVQITSGYATGETLGISGSQSATLTLSDSTVLAATYGNGTVTLSGNGSLADYGAALADITLTDAATSAIAGSHPKLGLSFTITEGSLTSTAATTQATVDRAPAVVAGGVTATATEGATATGASGAPLTGDTDADGDTISVSTVTHGATTSAAGTAVAGTYGTLTLNANGSYSYAASNTAAINAGATGSTLTDVFSFKVSDAVTATTESFAVTVLRPPVVTTDTGTAAYDARQAAVAVDPTLTLTDPDTNTITGATATITTGLATGDVLALGNNDGGALTGSYSGGVLSITGSASVAQYQAALDSITYASIVADPSNGGQDNNRVVSFAATDSLGVTSAAATRIVSEQPACYLRGTAILTERGDVAVEDLRIGDCLVTATHGLRPIKWIGWRGYAGRFAAGKRHLLPVRFRAGSLAEGLPKRDLLVSPEHAMFLGGVLIPARALVNGTTIVQERATPQIDYFHVELDSHDIIIAEGASSESFVDDDSRMVFHNAGDYAALYPNTDAIPPVYCAPRLEQGARVEAIRRRLTNRAGVRRSA